MTCHDAEPFLLNPQLDAGTQAHVETCADCQSVRAELMASQGILRAHVETPAPPALRTAFYTMLGDLQRSQTQSASRWTWLQIGRPRLLRLGMAFMTVFALGALSMYLAQSESRSIQPEVEALVAQLEAPSPTLRLTGIYTVSDGSMTEARVRDALITVIQTDPSVNVRVAALEALAPSTDDPDVRTAIVHVLGSDSEPLVQLAALRVLEAHQSTEVRQALDELLEQPDLEPLVRDHVRAILL